MGGGVSVLNPDIDWTRTREDHVWVPPVHAGAVATKFTGAVTRKLSSQIENDDSVKEAGFFA